MIVIQNDPNFVCDYLFDEPMLRKILLHNYIRLRNSEILYAV